VVVLVVLVVDEVVLVDGRVVVVDDDEVVVGGRVVLVVVVSGVGPGSGVGRSEHPARRAKDRASAIGVIRRRFTAESSSADTETLRGPVRPCFTWGMRVVVAPDKFKGTASASAMATALADALAAAGHEVDRCPLADGGEGFLDVLGGPNRTTIVTGPLGAPVDARWRLAKGTAVIEMAEASGLVLAGGPEGNDAVEATTRGVGELLLSAVEAGARRIVVGVGGSATTDGGLGALKAMHPTQKFRGIDLSVACDVRTRFVDAAEVFAPQKGASPSQVAFLRRRLERLAQVYKMESGVDVADVDGSGAAGGLAGGLLTVGADLVSGFDYVADAVGLDELIESADLVITGEGFLDDESFDGKVVGGVAAMCAEFEVPCVAIVGEVVEPLPELPRGLTVVSMVERFGEERSIADPIGCALELALGFVER